MQIRWLRKALRNLEQAHEYIAKENPEAAGNMVRKIQSAVHQLTTYPLMGRPGRVEETRELVISTTPYIVVYRVQKDVIEILRVLHTSQRWPDLFQ